MEDQKNIQEIEELTPENTDAGASLNGAPVEAAPAPAKEKKKKKVMETNDYLAEILKVQKKLLVHERAKTAVNLLIIVAIIVGLIFLYVAYKRISAEIEPVLEQIRDVIETVDEEVSPVLEQIREKLDVLKGLDPDSFKEMFDGIGDKINTVTDGIKNFAKLDPDAINRLMNEVSGKMDSFSDALSNVAKLDPNAINNLLNRLDDVLQVSDRLHSVMEPLVKFFGG